MKPFFSIIIPVYNAEKSIPRCIDSIINQQAEKEILLVDDCSQDNTIKEIKEYCRVYPYIKLITHESNKGSGGARNTGVLHARGEYLLFIDSDDYLKENALRYIQGNINKENEPDVIIYSFQEIDKSGRTRSKEQKIEKHAGIHTGDSLYNLWINGDINPAPWNKAFRHKFWQEHSFKFSEHISHDDLALIPYAFSMAKTASVIPNQLYYYTENTNGITYTITNKRIHSSIQAVDNLIFNFTASNKTRFINNFETDMSRIAYRSFNFNFKTKRKLCSDQQIALWTRHTDEFNKKYNIPYYFLTRDKAAISFFLLLTQEIKVRKLHINCFSNYNNIKKTIIHSNLVLYRVKTYIRNLF